MRELNEQDARDFLNLHSIFVVAPAVARFFYIGGYQPAQKWLKDRKGRQLSFNYVKHYHHIMQTISMTLDV